MHACTHVPSPPGVISQITALSSLTRTISVYSHTSVIIRLKPLYLRVGSAGAGGRRPACAYRVSNNVEGVQSTALPLLFGPPLHSCCCAASQRLPLPALTAQARLFYLGLRFLPWRRQPFPRPIHALTTRTTWACASARRSGSCRSPAAAGWAGRRQGRSDTGPSRVPRAACRCRRPFASSLTHMQATTRA